ncbi:MAG: WecB/TagA/CpsF family glycosyltransferase [Firmicutes bacterium]|nr:WecB/TagA/CpsF family glycosyltransferase [Bacillota bacterium]
MPFDIINLVREMVGLCMKEYFKRLYNKTADSFYKLVKKNLKNNAKQFIVTANPETFMKATQDEELNKMLMDENTTIVPDGIGIVKAARILDYDIKERIPGIDIANKLLEYGNELNKSIYMFGAQEEVIVSLKEVLTKNYPNLKIVGAQNGYEKDRDKIFKDIIKKEPDIVLVALGIPEQEKLIYKYLDKFQKGIFVGVGGSFDVISGHKKRAPKIFRKLNLEWLYRILKEPKRIKRFYDSNVKFLFRVRKLKKKENKVTFSDYLTKFFFVSYFIFSIYWLIIVFNHNKSRFGVYFIILAFLFALIFYLFKKYKLKINTKIIVIALIILSILFRLPLIFLDYADPTSDYATFYYNAVYIATGTGSFSSKYISAFPYLYGYIFVLGQFMKIFGSSYSSVIILNILLDLLGASFIYLFTKKINKKAAVYSLLIWLFNPFNIYFSIICSPIIIVNTFFALVLYISSLLFSNLDNRKLVIIYSLLLGISLSIANVFRPIMIIFVIAIFIYLTYLIFEENKIKTSNLIIGFLLVFCTYQIGNQVYYKIISNVTCYEINKSLSGWTIFVGSNTETSGTWSELNSDTYDKYYYSSDYTPEKFSDKLQKLGIERYKNNGIINNTKLFIEKSKVLAAKTNEYNYISFVDTNITNNVFLDKFVQAFTSIYWYFVVIFNFIFSIIIFKIEDYKKMIAYCLLVVGLCASTLIVEVSPRYFYPIFAPLTIVLALSIYKISNFFRKGEKYND